MPLSDIFTNWFKAKKPQQKTWPNWRPVGGYSSHGDNKNPGAAELIGAFDDVVFSCASLIADTVSSTPVKLFVKTEKGQGRPKCATRPIYGKTLARLRQIKNLHRGINVEEVCSHSVLDLLSKANGHHNRLDLFSLTQLFQEITGNSFWLIKFDPYGIPVGLFLLPTQHIEPVRDERGMVSHWKFGTGQEQTVYSKEEVIHFKFPSLSDPYGMGYAPLQAAWSRVQIQAKELGFLTSNLENQGRPDAILAPQEPISPFEAERLAKDFMHRFRGQGAGGVFVSDGPMQVTPIPWPVKDFAELNLYQTIKNAVSNAFHIPPELWELGQSNRASAESVLFALAVHCIKPRMARLVEKLNERLIPYYDDRLFFEAEAVVPDDKEFELREYQMLLATGCLLRNEVRQEYGYEPREWAEDPLLPPGSLPALAPELPPEQPQAEPEPQPQADRSGLAPALTGLQEAVYAGQLPREAAVQTVQLCYGLTPEQAEALFPQVSPVKLTPDDPAPMPEGPSGKGPGEALDLPDVRQAGSYDCGAAATASVCAFFGVGPADEADYVQALGTTEEEGTSAGAIGSYLQSLGLVVLARDDLEIADLSNYVAAGSPVICCIQDYEEQPQDIPAMAAGHWVVVMSADNDNVTFQDPMAGRKEMPTQDFLSRWQDDDENGDYVHYGIAVSKPQKGKGYRKKAVKRKSPLPMAAELQRFFRRQKTAVLTNVKAFDTKALPADNWFNLKDWTDSMYEVMRPVVNLYYDYSAKETVSRIGASPDLLKVSQPKLQEGVDRATLLFCEETNKTTALELGEALKALRGSLTEGLEAGEIQNQLTKRVGDIFEQAEVSRAYRIAVTEASRAQHAAMEITAQESGLVSGKRWILSDDACPLCLPMAGKVVPLGADFTQLESEGPYSAIKYPPLHPGCRCDMIEVIEGVNDA